MTDPKTLPPIPEDQAAAEKKGHPAPGAHDGKTGGETGGKRGASNFDGPSHGTNAQTGKRVGTEDERNAPGISTDKKADDTR